MAVNSGFGFLCLRIFFSFFVDADFGAKLIHSHINLHSKYKIMQFGA